ncbi:MAG: HDIG domain-containing protein [Planctomycetota bacterium]|nr:HDIG domain-containing protein [Planctomycetota bacterium]
MTRSDAAALVRAWVASESLRRHLVSVECVMEAAARRAGLPETGEDSVEAWRCVGLLHDLDYEKHPTPEEHPFVCVELLKSRGAPASWTEAILGHATYSGVPRASLLAKTLFAIDELTGFMTAVALVRPSRKIADVEVSSVKKKLKSKGFAAGVNREDIALGLRELNVEADAHYAFVLQALKDGAARWEGAPELE